MKYLIVLLSILSISISSHAQVYGWKAKPSGIKSGNFYDVKFWNKDTGAVVGNNDTVNFILITTDGGETWTNKASSLTTEMVRSCEFIDGKTLYVVGRKGSFYKTTNLGDTWIKVNLGTNADLTDISFPKKNRGYICANNGGYVYYDGIGWQSRLIYSKDNFINVKFPVDTAGIITAVSGRIWRTIDGGNTWDTIKRTLEPIYGSNFITANVGYIVGPKGKIKRTVNGGLNWTDTHIYAKNFKMIDFYSAYFVGQNVGFVGGTNGTILKTVNGGTEWIQENTYGTTETILKIYFVNPVLGFAVGTKGTILKRQDVSAIDEPRLNKHYIYPNPATEFIRISSEQNPLSLVLTDIGGKIILKKEMVANGEMIDISGLLPGIYLITITNENHVENIRLIKQ